MQGKGYFSVKMNLKDAKEIYDLLQKAGLDPIKPEKMHCTLMYDESNPEIRTLKNDKKYKAKITGVEVLGDAVVLNLDSPELEKRHQELKNAGYKHSFDGFECHSSVLYDVTDTNFDLVKLVFDLGVLPEEVTFYNETSESCD